MPKPGAIPDASGFVHTVLFRFASDLASGEMNHFRKKSQ
jgi:hypothetical protein